MKILGIIPSRYASTRFPAKSLTNIYGKPMIQRVYEQALQSKSLTHLVVATDDERIFNVVENFGGNVLMTSLNHRNGTERCAEVSEIISEDFDVVINIQGDEPFFESESIELIKECFHNPKTEIATLVKTIEAQNDLNNSSVVKAVISKDNKALYFSRFPIPFQKENNKLENHFYYKHIGIYGYKPEILKEIVQLKESSLEKAESLEQLRWLENGYEITTNTTTHDSNSVDTPEDLEELLGMFSEKYFQAK